MGMAEDPLRDFVVEAGRRLDRPPEEVEPYAKILADNWFDSPESLADTKPEELANQGIPLRFAKELITAAARGPRLGGGRRVPPVAAKGKGRGDSKGAPPPQRGGSVPAVRRREEAWGGGGGGGAPAGGELKQRIALWEAEPGFNLRGAVIGERGRNVHHIQDQTGARLWLHGEPGEPLRVEISAGNARDLSRAARLTRDLLGAVREEYEQWRREHGQWQEPGTEGKGAGKRQERAKGKNPGKGGKCAEPRDGRWREPGKGRDGIFREVLDLWECEQGFNIKGKVIGDSGRNVHHIQDQTGARLWLSGEPARLEVTADSPDGLRRAVQMAQDLLGAVYEEYAEWLNGEGANGGGGLRDRAKGKGGKDRGKDQGKGKRKDGGKASADGAVGKVIKLKQTDPAFRLRGTFIGDSGRNIHHIQDQTGARLWLHGESGQEMQLEIKASSAAQLESAVELAQDLIRSVYEAYDEWVRQGGADRDLGPGKGRGRRRDHRDDELPAKHARSA
uniref:K Homology domain-containing protein n=1 Tax=Alexandrium monilatum TaxID=311494 RepID=A0A7S4PTK7_9DINO